MNVFVTTLSTLNRGTSNLYYFQDENGEKKYCTGISANEAGAKYILSTEKIDRIVITGSDATYTAEDMELVNNLGSIGSLNSDDYADFADNPPLHCGRELIYLVYRLSEFLNGKELISEDYATYPKLESVAGNSDAEVLFVPLMRGESENLFEIIHAIRGDGSDEAISLYIDVQGGSRTDSYVMNAVFSILHDDDDGAVKIGRVVATDYSPNNPASRIIDETARYRISELVSGMNSFIRYGKAHAISSYLKESGTKDSRTKRLSRQMVKIDEAVSICDIPKLKNSIALLNSYLDEDASSDGGTASEIFRILEGEIRRDYGKLLILDEKGDPDIIELIEWCARKRFIHQALVMIETEIPELLYTNRILFCDLNSRVLLEKYALHGNAALGYKPRQAGESFEHYLVKNYASRLKVMDAGYCRDFKSMLTPNSDNSRYYSSIQNLAHEVFRPDDPAGTIRLFSDLDENEFISLISKYFILADQRNKVSHTDDIVQNRWGTEKLIKEILSFTFELKRIIS